MRKKDYEKELDRLKSNLSTSNRSIEHLIVQHDGHVSDINRLNDCVDHLKDELKLYTWAFSIACGRLMAHAKPDITPEEFTEVILAEARQELGMEGDGFQ